MRKCEICGKSYKYSIARKKVRSKYNPVNRKKTKANLQWYRLPSGKRVRACVRCIKTLKKQAAEATKK
jgi:ribosomal protein L28